MAKKIMGLGGFLHPPNPIVPLLDKPIKLECIARNTNSNPSKKLSWLSLRTRESRP